MIKIHENIEQGSEEWLQLRLGILTASEMKHIITPAKLQIANNDTARCHLAELVSQRISGFVERKYISDDMLRGRDDEIDARGVYDEMYAPVREVGFITNNKWGFAIGYSPDGLVGDDGLIEVKGRRQKYQLQTILTNAIPEEFVIQIQTGLLVSERLWCDFISYCGGLPMATIRMYADEKIQNAILDAATEFEARLQEAQKQYEAALSSPARRLIPTERRIHEEIFV